MKLAEIKKLIVMLVGSVIIIINTIWGLDLSGQEAELAKAISDAVTVVVLILTSFGVWKVTNAPKPEPETEGEIDDAK